MTRIKTDRPYWNRRQKKRMHRSMRLRSRVNKRECGSHIRCYPWKCWTNGIDHIIGPTLSNALAMMIADIDDGESYRDPSEWDTVNLDANLTIHDDNKGGTSTKTVREHIADQRKGTKHGYVIRLLCSTEY